MHSNHITIRPEVDRHPADAGVKKWPPLVGQQVAEVKELFSV